MSRDKNMNVLKTSSTLASPATINLSVNNNLTNVNGHANANTGNNGTGVSDSVNSTNENIAFEVRH